MRTMVPTVAGLLTLAAVSAQAAPLPPAKASPAALRAAPPIANLSLFSITSGFVYNQSGVLTRS